MPTYEYKRFEVYWLAEDELKLDYTDGDTLNGDNDTITIIEVAEVPEYDSEYIWDYIKEAIVHYMQTEVGKIITVMKT